MPSHLTNPASPANLTAADPIAALADLQFTLGNCRVIPYNRANQELFGDRLLNQLYDLCLQSRPSHPYGILPDAQCGMLDLSRDAITSYWYSRRITLVVYGGGGGDGESGATSTSTSTSTSTVPAPAPRNPAALLADGSEIAGFTYITTMVGVPYDFSNFGGPQPGGPRAALAAYAFFRPWWGSTEQHVLAMLGLAYLFHTFKLTAIHGQRNIRNALTARFMSKFGFRDTGVIPRFLMDWVPPADIPVRGKLVSCVVNSLLREDFEAYVTNQFRGLTLAGAGSGSGAVRAGGVR
jgi:hypothetical protein